MWAGAGAVPKASTRKTSSKTEAPARGERKLQLAVLLKRPHAGATPRARPGRGHASGPTERLRASPVGAGGRAGPVATDHWPRGVSPRPSLQKGQHPCRSAGSTQYLVPRPRPWCSTETAARGLGLKALGTAHLGRRREPPFPLVAMQPHERLRRRSGSVHPLSPSGTATEQLGILWPCT